MEGWGQEDTKQVSKNQRVQQHGIETSFINGLIVLFMFNDLMC